MEKIIVTIGREFGSRGGEIGRRLAEHFQIPLYDKNVLDQRTMEMHYIKPREIEHIDDLHKSGLPIALWNGADRELLRTIYAHEKDMIEVEAKKGSGIFVGRCAEYILQDFPEKLGVFVYAPMGDRINYISVKYGLSLEAAETLIVRMDKSRHYYTKYFTKENRGERHQHQLMLDSSFLGVDLAADLLIKVIEQKKK